MRPGSRALLFVLLAALGGCGGKSCARTRKDPAPAADAGPAPAPVSTAVTYSCADLGGPTCTTPPAPSDELVRLSEQLAELAARHEPPPAEWWTSVASAVDAALVTTADAGANLALPGVERVMIQNAALHVAFAAQAPQPELARRAMRVVSRLAPIAGFRDLLPEPIGLTQWLGPSTGWIERTHSGTSVHETAVLDTRFFRLVATKDLRANFAQLIAVDATGVPFITGVVGNLEVRRRGTPGTRACLVLADPAHARCNPANALTALAGDDPAKLPVTPFLRRDDGGALACDDCRTLAAPDSGATDAVLDFAISDLDPGEDTIADLDERRDELFERLRPRLHALLRLAGAKN